MKIKRFIFAILISVLVLGASIPVYADEVCATVAYNNTTVDYTSFQEAWSQAVSQGDTYPVTFTLRQNWKADSSGSLGNGSGFSNGGLSYSGKNELTVDLNGCSIDRNLSKPKEGGNVLTVNSTVTIADSNSDAYTVSKLFKGGAIQNGANSKRGGGIVVADNATLNMNGGTVLNCVSTDDGGGISIEGEGAKLNVNGGAFYGNRTYDASGECCGGAIYSSDAQLTIQNAVFEGNYAEDNGGAIYADDGSCTISNSSFYSNSSLEEGGALFTDGNNKSTLTECLFERNDSTGDDGGAVFYDASNGLYLNSCQMYYNHAGSEGGALFVNNDKAFVIGGNYQYNTAETNGGAFYVDSMYDLNIAGKLIIKDNTCSGKENDLCLQDGTASNAYLYCGGLYEGSSVWLCSNSTSSHLAVKSVDKFQYNNYIHFDSGFTLDAEKTVSTKLSSDDIRAEASILGQGNIAVIVVCIVIIIVLVVVMSIIKKKREAKANDEK